LELSFDPSTYGMYYYSQKNYNQVFLHASVLDEIVTLQTPLKVLKLSGLRNASVFSLLKLWRNQHLRLTELDISIWGKGIFEQKNNFWLQPEHLNWKTIPLPRHVELTRITLAGMIWLTEEVFTALVSPHTCPNLEYLNILGVPLYGQFKVLHYLFTSFPKLTSLVIGGTQDARHMNVVGIEGGEILQDLIIKFVNPDITFNWSDLFDSFPRLKKLKLAPFNTKEFWVEEEQLFPPMRTKARSLKYLYMANCRLSPKNISPYLDCLKNIEVLKLTHSYEQSRNWPSTNFQVLRTEEEETDYLTW